MGRGTRQLMGTSRGAAALGVGGPPAGRPGGDGREDHHRRKYIYVLPTLQGAPEIYILAGWGGPTGDSPVDGNDSPVDGNDSPVGGQDSPVGGPERRVKISKSRPRRVLRIKTGPLTMGKMPCTGHHLTSPIVKDPYSNCVLGTERLHGWHPPNDGRRVCVEVRRNVSPPHPPLLARDFVSPSAVVTFPA